MDLKYIYAYGKITRTMVHHNNSKHQKNKIPQLTPLIMSAAIVVSSLVIPIGVRADQLQEKIDALSQQRDGNQRSSELLGVQAGDLNGQIAALQTQIASVQAQIDLNTARQQDLETQITAAQAKLDEQRGLLAVNIRSMYIENETSPLEIVISGENISSAFDKLTIREQLKSNIKNTMDEIDRLKGQLTDQKNEVVRIINEQSRLRASLDQKNAEAGAALAQVNASKADFDAKVNAQSQQIATLRAQQRAANARYGSGVVPGDPNRGGYPTKWADAPQDSLVDSWGMYNRECVSYAAWRVSQSGRNMPYWGGRGHAREWPDNTTDKGKTPKVGAVAIAYWGYYGHAMYVERVEGSRVYVSQYNYDVTGQYSEMWVNTSDIDWFLYFGS